MAQIVQQNTLNLTGLIVPDLYVVIQTPQQLTLNGVPTNVIGVVGTAQWGPVNQPAIFGTASQYAQTFGAIQNRRYDMGTPVMTAIQQGAQAFVGVRVTDGTDAAAIIDVGFSTPNYSMLLTARYTGTLGNQLSFVPTASPIPGSYRFTIGLPGRVAEIFDIPLVGTGYAAFWAAAVAAINTGLNQLRGPSQLVTATLGTLTTTLPSAVVTTGALTGAGGLDGVTTLTDAVILGNPATSPPTGVYALQNQGCSIGIPSDCYTASSGNIWSTIESLGEQYGIYFILSSPPGDTIATCITSKTTYGPAGYGAKLLFGDWIYWLDQVNGGITRLVSPQGFAAGRLSNLSPEQSSLNKPIYGILGTQQYGLPGSGQANTYSNFELQTLFGAGIDLITTPQPGGAYWGCRYGHNSSTDARVNGDNYTRMTNYIAATLAAGMGLYVGQPINLSLMQSVKATQTAFLMNLLSTGVLAYQPNGALPFSVVCDSTNNPFNLTSLGILTSNAQVQYQAINEKFIVNVMGGQTVSVNTQLLPS
jgi:uncharacterized protein